MSGIELPGGDGRFMDGQRVMDWAQRARPGETLTYCVAERLVPQAAAIPRALAEAGVVDLVSKRRGKGWVFIAQRRTARFVDPSVPRRMPSRGAVRPSPLAVGRASERALLRILVRCARAGATCPSNATLARMTGLSGKLSVSYRLRRLVAAGRIVIEQPHPWGPRVVTIVASGVATARMEARK